MDSTALVTLELVQQRVGSRIATDSLWFPPKVDREIVLRLETARLVINERQWLKVVLQPLLQKEVDTCNMWKPGLLLGTLLGTKVSVPDPIVFGEYFRYYKMLYKGSRWVLP